MAELALKIKADKGSLERDLKGAFSSASKIFSGKFGSAAGGLIGGAAGALGGSVLDNMLSGILSSLRISTRFLEKIMKILELIMRPVDYVIGRMLFTFMRLIMPLVRVVNMMFRPFMQRIQTIMSAAAGGGADAQSGALLDIANEFGNFVHLMFSSLLGEALTTLNNIIFAVAETIVVSIAVLATFITRLLAGEEAANAVAGAFGNIIAGMDFARMAINTFIDYGLDAFAERLLSHDPVMFTELATSFDDLIQGAVLGIASIDPALQTAVSEGFDVANKAIADLKLILGEQGLGAGVDFAVDTIQNSFLPSIGTFASDVYLAGLESTIASTKLGMVTNALKAFNDRIQDTIRLIRDIERKAKEFAADPVGKTKASLGFNDFIFRPGQAPISFSPDDTLIGIKDLSRLGGGGGGMSVTVNVAGFVGSEAKLSELIGKELRKQISLKSTYGRSVG